MIRPLTFRGRALSVALAGLALCLPHGGAAQTPDNNWHVIAGIDLWAPTINGNNGKLKYTLPPDNPLVEIGPNDYFQHVKAAVPVFAEARKGDFSIFAELLYLSLTSPERTIFIVDGGLVPLRTSSSIKGLESTLFGGYTVTRGPAGTFDVIGGLRYFGARTTTDFSFNVVGTGGGIVTIRTDISAHQDLWDGVAGVRGQVNLGRHWFLPYYADIGAGTSSLTYQLIGGVAYSWSWGNTGVVFRQLYYDQKDDKLLQNLRFGSPALYIAFRR
jgi:hypothetical protein